MIPFVSPCGGLRPIATSCSIQVREVLVGGWCFNDEVPGAGWHLEVSGEWGLGRDLSATVEHELDSVVTHVKVLEEDNSWLNNNALEADRRAIEAENGLLCCWDEVFGSNGGLDVG
ncbi:hypothetical protein TanjilG_28386 [Lupinus angustifolius]|uniref:Uncharacterized protein n=1 Tax=Lupinus angustifolius TaxID=3871 RepID=A0A394DDJ4_LUPAN|nr:hypothetical protein TanjilG_28386 [Lupinus angustifolius]